MSFLSSFGKRPPPKTQQVVRPAAATRPVPDAQRQASSIAPAKTSSNAMRSRADFLRDRNPINRSTQPATTKKRTPTVAAALSDRKRKSATPSTPQFDSDSEEEDHSFDNMLHATKRPRRADRARVDEARVVRDVRHWSTTAVVDGSRSISGALMTSESTEKEYVAAFPTADGQTPSITLHYPNAIECEEFQLVVPRKADSYLPLRDVVDTIEQILEHFLPESDRDVHLDDMNGMPRRLRKALNTKDLDGYKRVIDCFNTVVDEARENGTIARILDASHTVPYSLVERILDQVTARTVSPQSEKLRQYESFSSNTYGELREEFNSQIFRDTEMSSSSVFVDLGSGVGNVVLQAALEIGCESYGIEMMPNPCELAQLQAKEFATRCRMWGVATGRVELLDGDFLEDTRLGPVLAKADVVLVNNELFSSDLNEKLRARFLDLKEGARIVSLKSFVPPGWRLTERTSEDPCGVLDVVRKEYWSGCVSWTNQGGTYFVSTKDTARIERILRGVEGR